MTEQSNLPEPQAEFTLVDLLTAIGEEKTLIAGITVCWLAPWGSSWRCCCPRSTPPNHLAAATAKPECIGRHGRIPGRAGRTDHIAAAFKTPEELYVGLLKTDTVANALINRFKLKDCYERRHPGQHPPGSWPATCALRSIAINSSAEADDTDAAFAARWPMPTQRNCAPSWAASP